MRVSEFFLRNFRDKEIEMKKKDRKKKIEEKKKLNGKANPAENSQKNCC